jgi:molecular chaperone HscB
MTEVVLDPFTTMGLPARYDIDRNELEARYRELSKVLHPDKHTHKPAGERRLSLGKAVEVNEAYRVLKDDLARAKALLALEGHEVAEGKEPQADPMFLMEIMELREALSEARGASDLDQVAKLGEKVSAMQRETSEEMATAFDALAKREGDAETVAALLGRLRYYRRFLDEVEVIEDEALG